jgi:Ca2+-transporting ATPase
MTTVHAMPDGHGRESPAGSNVLAFMKGAPEVVLERCTSMQLGAETVPLDPTARRDLLAANESMANDALRVLGIAYKALPAQDHYTEDAVEADLVFLGFVGMMDPPRDEARDAVKVCRQVGIRPVMITGDHRLTAVAVAREVGIFREGTWRSPGEDSRRWTRTASRPW